MRCKDKEYSENTQIYLPKTLENTQIYIAKTFENTQI